MTDKEKAIKDLKEMLDNLDITNKYRLNIIRAIEYLQKESASEDFESEWKRYCDSKGGGAVTMNIKDVAKHFSQWQKEELMKDAIDTRIDKRLADMIGYTGSERVKVIIVKDND